MLHHHREIRLQRDPLQRRRRIVLRLAASCLAASLIIGPAPWLRADVADQQIEPEQIEQWVRELNANVFVARETATLNLVQAGPAAVDPLLAAVPDGNLEVATRVVFVLREMALSNDRQTRDAARGALVKLASDRESAAQRRAAAELAVLDTIREERALALLRRQGAELSVFQGFIGRQFVDGMVTLEIGPGWKGSLEDLDELRWLKNLERVIFSGERVTDEWVAPVQQLQNLRSLHIKRTRATARAAQYVKDLPKLTDIAFWYSPINDRAVKYLQAHQGVRNIELYGTEITPLAYEELQAALVATKVDYRQGGFLGVGGQPHPLGCVVATVHPGSAAADAGVKESDIIVRYNGVAVADFEQLRTLISADQARAEVTMEIVRGGDYVAKSFLFEEGNQLGLKGDKHLLGCQVTEVAQGSILDQLNVRPGDVIARYQQLRVTGPEDLEREFARSRPGDHVELHLLREGKMLKLTATLGEWQ